MTEPDVNGDFDRVIAAVHDRLSRNLRLRRTLPGDGRLRLDRQLPFLCVYRTPPQGGDNGTRDLVTTEAAYLFASGEPEYAAGIGRLCRTISEIIQEHFGALLLIEIWADEDPAPEASPRPMSRPAFRIVAPSCVSLDTTIAALQAGLQGVRLHGVGAEVEATTAADISPTGQSPLAPDCSGCVTLGIAVRPVYRASHSGVLFPIVLQSLRRQLAIAIRKTVFAFTGRQEGRQIAHFEALGPSAIARAGRDVDQQLAEISQSFEFLLYSTPVNSDVAWQEFAASGHRRLPVLYYRPLPYDPTMLKRQLYSVPVEHVEDSTLAQLFEHKQDELGQQLDALKRIGTPGFFYDSLHLHGKPDDELVQLADDILVRSVDGDDESDDGHASCQQVAAAAREHIDHYHQQLPDFHAKVALTSSIASALMVAHDQLFISETASIRHQRVEPLMHHEVGTHLLTYFNGRQQPLRQLYAGFPRYEALQEGLAVLAEYLVGGLTVGRTRILAARVVAVQSLIEGASFVDTFDMLHRQRGLGARAAFMTTLRVHRGGGLLKDALYLRGLRDLLSYLRKGHDLEPLYVGKISLEHVSLVQELRRRGLVEAPALLPRFWEDPAFAPRLEKCRHLSLLDLLES
jgi:uncharacterized protein (TIGR02421 family)